MCCLFQIEDTENITDFYSQVFVPKVEPSLLQLHQPGAHRSFLAPNHQHLGAQFSCQGAELPWVPH